MLYTTDMVEDRVSSMQPAVDRAIRDNPNGIAIYGAGFVGVWAADYLRSVGTAITHFIDRDPEKENAEICGIPVVQPADPVISSDPTIYVATRHSVQQVMEAMAHHGANLISFDAFYVVHNYQRFAHVRDHYLSDGRSVETYNAILMAMLTGSPKSCRDVMVKDMYFAPPEFSATFGEIYLDAGAFVGDTVEQFIWHNMGTFRHLYAFEPGKKQFAALQTRMARLYREWAIEEDDVTLVNGGLAENDGRMACTFVHDDPIRHGLANHVGDRDRTVPVYALDSFLQGRPITFLKADIEGMEMDLLRGAQSTIKTHRPKMAICAYHYPSDLYEIAEYVRGLVPEYRFRLMQHVPILGDYVLYCYCEDH